jgi:hypothetical protein
VLWICIGFNADPDPAFEVNADPDPYPGIQVEKFLKKFDQIATNLSQGLHEGRRSYIGEVSSHQKRKYGT